MKQSIFEASEALQKWEVMILKKTRSFRWFSSNCEVEATWARPHKTSNVYEEQFLKIFKSSLSPCSFYHLLVCKAIYYFLYFTMGPQITDLCSELNFKWAKKNEDSSCLHKIVAEEWCSCIYNFQRGYREEYQTTDFLFKGFFVVLLELLKIDQIRF